MMKMIISSKIPPITCPKNNPKLHSTSSIFFSSSSPQSYNRLSSQSHSSVTAVRSSLKSPRPPLVARASSSTAGISENIGDTLCDVSIYTASGESVMFKDLFDQNQELKQYPSLRVEVSNAACESLDGMRDESKKATLQLVEMECCYLTVDFFRKLPQDIEKERPDIKSQFNSLLYQLLLDPSERVCFEAIFFCTRKI